MFFVLSIKPRNIYPGTISSDLVPRPPETNHALSLVHMAEGAI